MKRPSFPKSSSPEPWAGRKHPGCASLGVLRIAAVPWIALAMLSPVGCASSRPAAAVPATSHVTGRLPPEQIQRVVRERAKVFVSCYKDGLRRNPSLQGQVTTRFVIARDGSVKEVTDGGSDIPDAAVVSCVVKSFETLRFPQPDGGTVTVTYPIVFSP